jgi:hypothetical protein
MDEVKQRLAVIKAHYGLSVKDFSTIWNVSDDQAKNYLSGRTKLPGAKIVLLSEKFGVNPSWLLTGSGEGPGGIKEIVSEPATQYRKGQAGRTVASNFKTQIRGLFSPIIDQLSEAVYDMFEVEGSSMETTLSQGDWLLCRLETIESMIDGRVYVLVVQDPNLQEYRPSGVWIKRCHYRKSNGYITCRSDNKESSEPYQTFKVNIDKVKELWYPVLRTTAHMADPNRDIYDRLDDIESRLEMLEMMNEE